ncbi:MAG: hypothetical protein WBP84_01355, partial [Nitrososphaeraceae archaeon]
MYISSDFASGTVRTGIKNLWFLSPLVYCSRISSLTKSNIIMKYEMIKMFMSKEVNEANAHL